MIESMKVQARVCKYCIYFFVKSYVEKLFDWVPAAVNDLWVDSAVSFKV